jgi:hypothetical protein
MRRVLALVVMVAAIAGCAHRVAAPVPAAVTAVGSRDADVYLAVLHRYLDSPLAAVHGGTVYVLDRANPAAADPMAGHDGSTPIAPDVQQQIVAGVPGVVFVSDPNSVLATDGCVRVKDGGILVTLGTIDGDGGQVKVGINGFVACLGATWLTYVVGRQPGGGWQVTGTTGPMAVA